MIQIDGDCLTAAMVRGCLQHEGFTLVLSRGKYNFSIAESGAVVTLDSVDGPLEASIYKHIKELAGVVTVQAAGGNQDADRMVLTVPANDASREATMLGILRALTDLTNHVPPRARPWRWYWPFVLLLLSTAPALAQTSEVTIVKGNNTATVNAAGRIEMTCPDGTCAGGGGASTLDGDPFTAGLSGVNVWAGVFDDTLANVTAGDVAAPRMTKQRALHVNIRDDLGNILGDASQPLYVQGTVATSPNAILATVAATGFSFVVNGYDLAPIGTEFGLITRNIPSGTQAVSGTFWQATQPVSSTQLPGALGANGGLKVEGIVGGIAQPVSGTFFQATQPISAVALPLPALASTSTIQTDRTQKTQITDGTRDGTVKAASTAAAAADTSVVVALSPNSPIPTGANTIGALTANQSVNTAQFGGTNVSTGTGAGGAGIPRVTVSNDSNVIVTPPTLTKGTQGSTGFSVQNLRDAGRTAISFYANAVASGTTGTETLITLTQSKGTAATSSASTYTITSGKTLRITAIQVGSRGHATATIQISTFNLRLNTAGACIVSSTPILMGIATATPATASAWDRSTLTLGDGYEIAGNGTIALCISANAVFVTNAPTWFVNIIGYEY